MVELFFQMNAVFNFIPSQTYKVLEFPNKFKTITDKNLKILISEYQNFNISNYSIRNELRIGGPRERHYKPFPPESFIEGKKYFITSDKEINDIHIEANKKIELFNVNYIFDENKIRLTKGAKRNANSKNIVLVGCSLVFGTGVNQGEDISSYLTQYMPDYNVYNMGIPSGGMSDFLNDIFIYKRLQPNQNGGAVVYMMIYDHLERTFCSLDCYRESRKNWILPKNYYELNEKNEVFTLGSHQKSKPVKYLIYSTLAKSEFLKYIGFDRPRIYDKNEIEKYLEFVKTLKNFYKKNFNLDFYVYLPHPNRYFPTDLVPLIESHGIKTFAAGNVPEVIRDKIEILGDGHWSQLGNNYHSLILTDYLKSEGY